MQIARRLYDERICFRMIGQQRLCSLPDSVQMIDVMRTVIAGGFCGQRNKTLLPCMGCEIHIV